MNAPKYHIGEQIVFGTHNETIMATIAAADVSSDEWRYHVVLHGHDGVHYVQEHDVKFYLDPDGHWYDPTKLRIDYSKITNRK